MNYAREIMECSHFQNTQPISDRLRMSVLPALLEPWRGGHAMAPAGMRRN